MQRNNDIKKYIYQVTFDGLFKNRKTSNNLTKIAHYVTKGGNENLRYNAGFGRDLTEDLEGKIWRVGLGRADKGGETIEDERGLSVAEVRALDELYRWLMDRRSDKRGYLIASSDR
jgi:leucyl aminopeptidase (aminopeptidase T)